MIKVLSRHKSLYIQEDISLSPPTTPSPNVITITWTPAYEVVIGVCGFISDSSGVHGGLEKDWQGHQSWVSVSVSVFVLCDVLNEFE
jgi:hypothetical protein